MSSQHRSIPLHNFLPAKCRIIEHGYELHTSTPMLRTAVSNEQANSYVHHLSSQGDTTGRGKRHSPNPAHPSKESTRIMTASVFRSTG